MQGKCVSRMQDSPFLAAAPCYWSVVTVSTHSVTQLIPGLSGCTEYSLVTR